MSTPRQKVLNVNYTMEKKKKKRTKEETISGEKESEKKKKKKKTEINKRIERIETKRR